MRTRANAVVEEPVERPRGTNNYFKVRQRGSKEAVFYFFDDSNPPEAESAFLAAKVEASRVSHQTVSIYRRLRWTVKFSPKTVAEIAGVEVVGETPLPVVPMSFIPSQAAAAGGLDS